MCVTSPIAELMVPQGAGRVKGDARCARLALRRRHRLTLGFQVLFYHPSRFPFGRLPFATLPFASPFASPFAFAQGKAQGKAQGRQGRPLPLALALLGSPITQAPG